MQSTIYFLFPLCIICVVVCALLLSRSGKSESIEFKGICFTKTFWKTWIFSCLSRTKGAKVLDLLHLDSVSQCWSSCTPAHFNIVPVSNLPDSINQLISCLELDRGHLAQIWTSCFGPQPSPIAAFSPAYTNCIMGVMPQGSIQTNQTLCVRLHPLGTQLRAEKLRATEEKKNTVLRHFLIFFILYVCCIPSFIINTSKSRNTSNA